MIRVADIVIDFLTSKGITDAFTVSGGGCIHLIDALRLNTGINTTCFHHEQSAVMAAEGYFRLKNQIAANIVTTGPGGTNTLTGTLGMWLDSIPGMIISGQVPQNQLSEGTGCRQIGDQEFDIISTVKPMTKYAVLVKNPLNILYELEKAYEISITGRPGPVWIDIPLDVQGAKVNPKELIRYTPQSSITNLDSLDLSRFIKLLENSKQPVVIVGNGIRLSNTYPQLNEFLQSTGIPVVTGPHSGVDAVDNTYEYYCGRIGILGQLTSNQIIQESDLIIGLGTRLPVKMTGYNIKEFAPNSKKIFVDIDENEVNKHNFEVHLKIILDLVKFFESIQNIKLNLDITEWQLKVKDLRSKQIYYYPKHENLKDYASFYYLINKAPKYFKQTPIITSDGTAHVITLQTYNLNQHQRLFTNVGCASMGYGLPASIGACIANNKQVICIEGDGSIMMNLQELQTITHYNLPIKLFVINNEGYLSIKLSQESFFQGNEFASGPDTGVSFPSFEDISKVFNLKYFSIKSNQEVHKLEDIMSYEGPCLIEVFTHPKERHEPKVTHKGIDENGKIIPGTLTDMFISDTF